MRNLSRNSIVVYYSNPTGTTEITDADGYYTGTKTITYANATSIRMNKVRFYGSNDLEYRGIVSAHSNVLVTTDKNCPITEESRLWIDRLPSETIGGVVVNNPHNYVVTAKEVGLNEIVYWIDEVSVC